MRGSESSSSGVHSAPAVWPMVTAERVVAVAWAEAGPRRAARASVARPLPRRPGSSLFPRRAGIKYRHSNLLKSPVCGTKW